MTWMVVIGFCACKVAQKLILKKLTFLCGNPIYITQALHFDIYTTLLKLVNSGVDDNETWCTCASHQ